MKASIFPEMGQKTSNLLEQRIFRTELEINFVPAQKIASVFEIESEKIAFLHNFRRTFFKKIFDVWCLKLKE